MCSSFDFIRNLLTSTLSAWVNDFIKRNFILKMKFVTCQYNNYSISLYKVTSFDFLTNNTLRTLTCILKKKKEKQF